MSFPRNKAEDVIAGLHTSRQRPLPANCAVVIEFWMTPHQRRIPMNVMDGDSAVAVSLTGRRVPIRSGSGARAGHRFRCSAGRSRVTVEEPNF